MIQEHHDTLRPQSTQMCQETGKDSVFTFHYPLGPSIKLPTLRLGHAGIHVTRDTLYHQSLSATAVRR